MFIATRPTRWVSASPLPVGKIPVAWPGGLVQCTWFPEPEDLSNRMDKLIRTDLAVEAERRCWCAWNCPTADWTRTTRWASSKSLARTAGAVVVDEMLARRHTINPALYVGTGKAKEIATRAEADDADVVIFDNDLSPAQIRDLEEIADRKVLDRSELILDIFAARARTHEARLQVELAQLEYTYPRLRHMWTHLERIAGGATRRPAVGGIGTRGPGEKQIEIDRRLVQKRVSRPQAPASPRSTSARSARSRAAAGACSASAWSATPTPARAR